MREGVIVRADDLEWTCDTQGPLLRTSDVWARCWVDEDLGLTWVHTTTGWCCVPMTVHAGTYGAPRAERREVHAERVADTEVLGSVLGVSFLGLEALLLGVAIAQIVGAWLFDA